MKELYYKREEIEEDKQSFVDRVMMCDTIEEYQKTLRTIRKDAKDPMENVAVSVSKQQTFTTLFGIEVNSKGVKIEREDDGVYYLTFTTVYIIKPKA